MNTFTNTEILVSDLIADMRRKISDKMNTLTNNIGAGEYELKLKSWELNDFIRQQLQK
jgi:hypothetical protein